MKKNKITLIINNIKERDLDIAQLIISAIAVCLLIILTPILLADYAPAILISLDSIFLSAMMLSSLLTICYESLVMNKKSLPGPIEVFLNQCQENHVDISDEKAANKLFIYLIIFYALIALTAKFLPYLLVLTCALCIIAGTYGFLNTIYPGVVVTIKNRLYKKYSSKLEAIEAHIKQNKNKYTDIAIFIFACSLLLLCFSQVFFINFVIIISYMASVEILLAISLFDIVVNEFFLENQQHNFGSQNHIRHCLIWLGILPPAILLVITLSPSHIWLFTGICLSVVIYDIVNTISPIKFKSIIENASKKFMVFLDIEPLKSSTIWSTFCTKEKTVTNKGDRRAPPTGKYLFNSQDSF